MEKTPPGAQAASASLAQPGQAVAILAGLWVLTGAAFGSVLPFLAVYAARRGLTLAEIGLLGAISAGAAAMLQPLMGRMVDRTGRRRLILVTSLLIGAAGFSGLGFATTAPLIIFCSSLGTAGFYSSRVVIVAATVNAVEGSGRGAALYARYRICPSFGYTIMAVGGGALLGHTPFAVLFGIGATFYLVAGGLGLALPPLVSHQSSSSAEHERRGSPISPRRVVTTLALMSLLYYVASSCADTYVPLLMRQLHGTFTDVGIAGTISAVVEIPLMIVVGNMADRSRQSALLAVGMALVPLRFAAYFLVRTPLELMCAQTIDGLTFSTYAVAGIALLSAQTPREERALALSIYSAGGTFGTIMGPLVAGFLASGLGLQPMLGLFAIGGVAVPATAIYGLWPLLRSVPSVRGLAPRPGSR